MSSTPKRVLPYGRQWVSEEDIATVVDVLRGDWLTTGPNVDAFEQALCEASGASHGVAISNGTAALHAAYDAAGLGPGDEVIVPSQTFSATANAALYCGATVKFADNDDTLTIDPEHVKSLITDRTKIISAVDFTGHVCDMDALRAIADEHGCHLVEDAAHSLGAAYKGRPVGTLADMTTFSFHPVKIITTAEGGAIMTSDDELHDRLARFRTHGIERGRLDADPDAGDWAYEIEHLGYNYRLTDVQCALGTAQLGHLSGWIEKRQQIAARYNELLASVEGVRTPVQAEWCTSHAWHLYIIRVDAAHRRAIFDALREAGILVQVHYIPVNMLKLYRDRGHHHEDTPRALQAYHEMISLPCYPLMKLDDVDHVVDTLKTILAQG
jgi:perosamine synthetase